MCKREALASPAKKRTKKKGKKKEVASPPGTENLQSLLQPFSAIPTARAGVGTGKVRV